MNIIMISSIKITMLAIKYVTKDYKLIFEFINILSDYFCLCKAI